MSREPKRYIWVVEAKKPKAKYWHMVQIDIPYTAGRTYVAQCQGIRGVKYRLIAYTPSRKRIVPWTETSKPII